LGGLGYIEGIEGGGVAEYKMVQAGVGECEELKWNV